MVTGFKFDNPLSLHKHLKMLTLNDLAGILRDITPGNISFIAVSKLEIDLVVEDVNQAEKVPENICSVYELI